jgi:hypothetical protein
VGKEYIVQAVPISFSMGQGTDIDADDIKFLVYNDVGEWQVYVKEFFIPAGQ